MRGFPDLYDDDRNPLRRLLRDTRQNYARIAVLLLAWAVVFLLLSDGLWPYTAYFPPVAVVCLTALLPWLLRVVGLRTDFMEWWLRQDRVESLDRAVDWVRRKLKRS
jgi:hypothetical protein